MTEEKPEASSQAQAPAEPESQVQKPAAQPAQQPAQAPPAAPQTQAPQQSQPGAEGDYQDVDMMAQANAFLQKPMVKKYVGGMGKMMIFFAIMGSLVMVAAITAITSLFNMIIPK